MKVTLTNISGGQLVFNLADGKTLRLNNKQSDIITESQVTKHIKNLVQKRLLLSKREEVKVVDRQVKKKKEEISNGTVQ